MILFGCDHRPLITQLRADLAAADARATSAEARLDSLAERYDALVRASLRPQGVVVEAPPGSTPAAPAPEVDALKVLIHERAGANVKLRGLMLAQLAVDRAAKIPDDTIRESILSGVQDEGVPV